MPRIHHLAGIAILPVLGALLLATGGCGAPSYPTDPEIGARQKQTRITAYGPSGTPSGKPGATALNPQAAARQKAQGGGR